MANLNPFLTDKHFFCRWTSYIARVLGLLLVIYAAFVSFPYKLLAIAATLFLGSMAFRPRKAKGE